MAGPLVFDRVLETTTTTGTGTLTLAGAVSGYQTFADVGNSNTTPYAVWEVDANGNPSGAWEVGIGTYTVSGTTLARTTLLDSSTGSAISFAAGTKRVGAVLPALYAHGAMLAGRGYIQGGGLTYSSTTAFIVDAMKLAINNKILSMAQATYTSGSTMKDLANATVTLGASKGYLVFAFDNAGTLEGRIEEFDATGDGASPVFDLDLDYWKAASTGAAARRIGKLWTNSSSEIQYFLMTKSGRERTTDLVSSAQALLTNGTSTTYASITITPFFSGDDNAMLLNMRPNLSTGTNTQVYSSITPDGGTNLSSAGNFGAFFPTTGADPYSMPQTIKYSGTLHYKVSGTNGRLTLYAAGFKQFV